MYQYTPSPPYTPYPTHIYLKHVLHLPNPRGVDVTDERVFYHVVSVRVSQVVVHPGCERVGERAHRANRTYQYYHTEGSLRGRERLWGGGVEGGGGDFKLNCNIGYLIYMVITLSMSFFKFILQKT